MNANITRKQDLGVAGNGGEFASRRRAEPSFALMAAGAPQGAPVAGGGLRLEQGAVVRAPEGDFTASDAGSDWGRQAILAGALRRFGVSRQEYDKAVALMHNQRGGQVEAREMLDLSHDQLNELTATSNDLRNRKGPHFINGAGPRKDWAVLTASGLGQLPLERTTEQSVYRIAYPPGSTDTIKVTDRGTLEFAGTDGTFCDTDGAGVNSILADRSFALSAPTPSPIRVHSFTPTPSEPKALATRERGILQRLFGRQ